MRRLTPVVVLALLAVAGIGIQPAAAAPQASVKPITGPVGTAVTVTGSAFSPGFPPCRVEFEMTPGDAKSRVIVVTENACAVDGSGGISETFQVPSGAALGSSPTRVWVCNYCNGGEFAEIATAAFEVTAPASPSPSPTPTSSSPSTSPTSSSPSPSAPASSTSTPTPSASPSASPSGTTTSPTPTPTTTSPTTASPTPTPTSASPTAGATPSPTASATPTPSPSPSATPLSLLTDLPLVERPPSLGSSVLSGITVADLQPLIRPDVLRLLFPPDRCAAPPGATVVGFDDLAWNDAVTDQYAGVTFVSQPAGILRVRDAAVGSISPPQVLANINTTVLGDRFELDTARGDIGVFFDELQTDVGTYVGLVGEAPYETTATMTAIDATGAVVASDSTTFGPGDVPVRQCLRVQQDAGDAAAIAGVSIVYDPPLPEAIDDLFFSASLPQPEERDLGAITWTRPLDGGRLVSDDPVFAGEVFSTAAVHDVRITWECDVPRDPDATSWSSLSWGRIGAEIHPDPANPLRTYWVARGGSLYTWPCGAETELRLRATATFEGWWTATSQIAVTYVSPRAVEAGDPVAIAAVEPTQGVRIRPLPVGADVRAVTDAMTHVADRPTVLRVYPALVDGLGREDHSGDLYARAVAFRGGRYIPYTETLPENGPVRVRSDAITVETQRRTPAGTWNFRLPAAWTTPGTTRVIVTAYPEGVTPSAYEACRCGDPPHTVAIDLTFAAGGAIDLHMFLMDYTFTGADGSTVRTRPTLEAAGDVINQAYRYLPLPRGGLRIPEFAVVPWEGAIEQTNDDGSVTYRLFDAMSTRYLAPAGITGPDVANRGTMYGFYFDGSRNCGGRGWLDQSFFNTGACDWASVPTHEALHTLGLAHASNRHGEADGGGFDASFPGICGQISYDAAGGLDARTFGVDVQVTPMRVIVPDTPSGPATDGEEGDCAARHVHDLLSYGWGEDWISPYTWENVTARVGGPTVVAAGLQDEAEAPEESLVVRLHIGADNIGLLGSVRAVAQPYRGESRIIVRALDRDEAVVAEQPVALRAPESGAETETGTASVVLPRDGWNTIELLRDGVRVAAMSLGEGPRPRITEPAPGTTVGDPFTIGWTSGGGHALVQASGDGGASWHTVTDSVDGFVELQVSQLGVAAGEALLRVQSGIDELAVASEPIAVTVPASPPLALILAPGDGEAVRSGEVLELTGQGMRPDGSTVAARDLTWLVDGQEVGSGTTWVVAGLDDGTHEIALRAVADGVESRHEIHVVVGADGDRDGILDDAELAAGLDPADPADASSDADGDGLDARTEIERGTDPDAADSDGDRYADLIELMGGSDPLDPASLPAPSHVFSGDWPQIEAAAPDGARGLPWLPILLGAAAVGALAAALALTRRRSSNEGASG